jgi:hypothetical protein
MMSPRQTKFARQGLETIGTQRRMIKLAEVRIFCRHHISKLRSWLASK